MSLWFEPGSGSFWLGEIENDKFRSRQFILTPPFLHVFRHFNTGSQSD